VHVPRDVKVIVDGHASAGEIVVFGEDVNGTSLHKVVSAGADDTRVLRLDARVGFGRLEVTRG
jgi:predicted membrane protein